MVETHDDFVERLNELGRKHEKMSRGKIVTKVTRDGLIVVEPKRQRLLPAAGLVKLLLLVLVGFVAFKSFTLAAYGPVTYNERLAELENGTVIEKMGAKALAIDPVSEALARTVGPVLR